MKRTTVFGTWALIIAAAAGLWYGMYWFFRAPSSAEPAEVGYPFVRSMPVDEGGIPPIDSPTFESVSAADQYLNDDGEGLDVELDGTHRFYPYQILVWHEVVNDQIGDTPVLVSYSPLTDTGMAYVREDSDGGTLSFAASGLLWNDNAILTDGRSGSHWVQAYGTAVDGDLSGTQLAPLLARSMTWSDWKAAFPRGEVMTRETGATRDYTRNPYGNYAEGPAVWYPLTAIDPRLEAKEIVYAVRMGDQRAAYPEAALRRVGTVRETIGGVPVEVAFDEDLGTARAWRLELDGDRGDEVPVTRGFWFLWAAAFPDIPLYELP